MKIRFFLIIILITGIAGSAAYLIYNERVIIYFQQPLSSSSKIQGAQSTLVDLFSYPLHNPNASYIREQTMLIEEQSSPSTNLQQLIAAWLIVQEAQDKIPLEIETLALSEDQKNLIISFSRSPFFTQASTYEKLAWIQGLLKTIATYNPSITQVYFLVHQLPITDYELDFSFAWPIKGYL